MSVSSFELADTFLIGYMTDPWDGGEDTNRRLRTRGEDKVERTQHKCGVCFRLLHMFSLNARIMVVQNMLDNLQNKTNCGAP